MNKIRTPSAKSNKPKRNHHRKRHDPTLKCGAGGNASTTTNKLLSIPTSSHLTKLSLVIGVNSYSCEYLSKVPQEAQVQPNLIWREKGKEGGKNPNPNQAQKSKKGRRVGKTPTPPNPMPPRRWTSSIYIPPVDKRLGGYAKAGTTTLSALLTVSKADKGLLRLKVQLDRSNLGLRAQTASLESKQATTK